MLMIYKHILFRRHIAHPRLWVEYWIILENVGSLNFMWWMNVMSPKHGHELWIRWNINIANMNPYAETSILHGLDCWISPIVLVCTCYLSNKGVNELSSSTPVLLIQPNAYCNKSQLKSTFPRRYCFSFVETWKVLSNLAKFDKTWWLFQIILDSFPLSKLDPFLLRIPNVPWTRNTIRYEWL